MKKDGKKDFESFSKPNDLLYPDLIDIWQLLTSRWNSKKKKIILKLSCHKDITKHLVNKENQNSFKHESIKCTLMGKIYKRETFVSKGSMAFKHEIM